MPLNYIFPEFEVVRNADQCVACRACERQCANEVHHYSEEYGRMIADNSKCVDCQRCVTICPTHALKIVKSDNTFRENGNWSAQTIKEIYRQADSGGALLSSMGNPQNYPVYWDKILINASQVTNPSIDPLREPMETRVFLGKKPSTITRDENGELVTKRPPRLELSVPIMFSAMSYGSISYNAHASLARAAKELGIYYNTGEGGLHEDFYCYGPNTIVQVASGRFGVHKDYLNAGAGIEIKIGQGAKPGIGGHLPGKKVNEDVSHTRMIPMGSDAISPAPHHDIYSIEDLRQLIYSLKEATAYQKPVHRQNCGPCTMWRRLHPVLPAAVRTSLPSTVTAAARALHPRAFATMWGFRLNWHLPQWMPVCAKKVFETKCPSSWAVPSAAVPTS